MNLNLLGKARMLTTCALALALAACAGAGSGTPPPATTASQPSPAAGGGFGDRVSSMLFGPPARPGEGRVEPALGPDCPPLDVRQGASTITIYGSGDRNATNVRYQATVGELARECAVAAGTMTVKVGLQGRVILGPAGGPGRLELPIRFALVREGPEPKTIWTELYRVPVDIPQGETNVAFVHVDDKISFPAPSASEFDAYVFYVGFDQQGLRERPQRRRTQTRR